MNPELIHWTGPLGLPRFDLILDQGDVQIVSHVGIDFDAAVHRAGVHDDGVFLGERELLGVQPPMFIEVEITETDPGFKGDTVQGGTKPATLETGFVVKVPMFINEGDVLQIDTRTGEYMGRA